MEFNNNNNNEDNDIEEESEERKSLSKPKRKFSFPASKPAPSVDNDLRIDEESVLKFLGLNLSCRVIKHQIQIFGGHPTNIFTV